MPEEKTKTVLIVDNDPVLPDIYREYFLEESVDIKHVHDTEKALRTINEEEISLVLTEHILGQIDGIEIARCARPKKIPVIIYTDMTDRGVISECFDEGACEYVIKQHSLPAEVIAIAKKFL
jgi:two-component system, OmpR family, response regulator